jgi:hypothetical protein
MAVLVLAILPLRGAAARADDTVRHPGDHLTYGLELEPHATFGWGGPYGGDGGVPTSIPCQHVNFDVSVEHQSAWASIGGYAGGGGVCRGGARDLVLVAQGARPPRGNGRREGSRLARARVAATSVAVPFMGRWFQGCAVVIRDYQPRYTAPICCW